MRTRYRVLVILLILVGMSAWFLNHGQYKLDPLEAARTSAQVGKDAQVIGQAEYPWGRIYLFPGQNGTVTVTVTKTKFLWQNQGAKVLPNNADVVQTVSWQRVINGYSHEATIFAVVCTDEKVAFIEAGSAEGRVRKEVKPNSPVIFSWDTALELVELKAYALSAQGKVLYEFRYPRNKAIVTAEDLRWYRSTL